MATLNPAICRGARLDSITLSHDDHSGKCAHDGEVLDGVMRGSHRAVSEAVANSDNFYVGVVISDVVADVFEATHARKIPDGVRESDLAAQGYSGGYAGHVLFGNTSI